MNERYLFRAWIPELKKMVYPNAIRFVSKGIAIEYDNEDGDRCIDGPGWFELMPCTGLGDKNGKFIYESDIVRYTNSEEEFDGVIEWKEQGWMLIPDDELDGDGDCLYYPSKCYEVIGNVHDGLLEGGGDE